jgi:prephenate dehydrogenase
MGGSQHPRVLSIVGLGLMGGSLARAVKEAGLPWRVRGMARDPETRRSAREAGAVDEACADPAAAAAGAALVVLALPVRTIPAVVAAMAPHLAPGAVVTDVGSTKLTLGRRVEALLPPGVVFVGGHPIAGTEESGFTASFAGLYRGARCLLTPGATSTPAAIAEVRALWEAVGSRVEVIDAAAHDRILAVISHLPHVVAYALVNAAAAADRDHPGLLSYTGGGFRDFTRIAASHPGMWRDICLDNRTEILAALDLFLHETGRLRAMIEAEDGDGIAAAFTAARIVRRSLAPPPPSARPAPGDPDGKRSRP